MGIATGVPRTNVVKIYDARLLEREVLFGYLLKNNTGTKYYLLYKQSYCTLKIIKAEAFWL